MIRYSSNLPKKVSRQEAIHLFVQNLRDFTRGWPINDLGPTEAMLREASHLAARRVFVEDARKRRAGA